MPARRGPSRGGAAAEPSRRRPSSGPPTRPCPAIEWTCHGRHVHVLPAPPHATKPVRRGLPTRVQAGPHRWRNEMPHLRHATKPVRPQVRAPQSRSTARGSAKDRAPHEAAPWAHTYATSPHKVAHRSLPVIHQRDAAPTPRVQARDSPAPPYPGPRPVTHPECFRARDGGRVVAAEAQGLLAWAEPGGRTLNMPSSLLVKDEPHSCLSLAMSDFSASMDDDLPAPSPPARQPAPGPGPELHRDRPG